MRGLSEMGEYIADIMSWYWISVQVVGALGRLPRSFGGVGKSRSVPTTGITPPSLTTWHRKGNHGY